MIERQSKGKRVRVTFAVPATVWQGGLSVVGDFNDWDPKATPLKKRGDLRTATVTLDPGTRYAFRYLGEGGEWFNDETADAYEHNEFGAMNGVLDLVDAS